MVRTALRVGVIGAVVLLMGGGVAAAEPLPLAEVSRSAVTHDGWQLTASLKNMTINSVPNFAATAFTREPFVSGEADASIDGNGTSPVNAGSLIVGLQVGCQIDLSSGGNLGVGQSAVPFAPVITLKLLPGWITNVGLAECHSRAAPQPSSFMTQKSKPTRAAARLASDFSPWR
jgi:hypothetical protein